MNENKPNNQVPVTNNMPTTKGVPVSSGVPSNGAQNNNLVNTDAVKSDVVVEPVAVPVQNKDNEQNTPNEPVKEAKPNIEALVETDELKKEESAESKQESDQVAEIIASSIEQKGKVNLLTPEQKAELIKKREEARKEKESYQPQEVSKAKRFVSIMILVLLFAVVFFLPNINGMLVSLKDNGNNEENVIITTGTLRCTRDDVSDKYNLSYTYEFDFTDSQLDKLTYIETTVGDELVDETDLNLKLEKCNSLKSLTTDLNGVSVSCSLFEGTLTKEQMINFNVINRDLVTAAYAEAGGIYPEFEAGDSIDMIERNMKAANNTCERIK